MGKRLNRLTAGLLSALLLISVIPFVVATGALADWKSTRGNPQLKETADGEFCNFFVDSACTVSTAEAHDMLSEAIVLRNLSLANGHWFYVGLSADAAEGWSFNDIAKGKLGFFVENTSDGIRFIFNANWQQIVAVKKADTYTLRFVKDTDGTYGLQVNGTLAKHGDIDAYCKSGKTDSFVILTTSNWAKGDIRVGKLDWVESTSAVAVPSVSALVTGDTQVALSGGSVVTTTAKLDWNTQKLDVYKLTPSGASDRLCISLNKTAASTAFQPSAADGSVVSIALTPVDDQMEISLLGETETKLGAVPQAYRYALGIVQSGEHFQLAVNGNLFSDSRLDALMGGEGAGQTYVSLSATDSVSAILGVHSTAWKAVAGNPADMESSVDGSCTVALTDGQAVQSPQRYDFLNSDIVLKSFNLPESSELSLYIGKAQSDLPPANLTENGWTLLLKKAGEKLELAALDSAGQRVVLGTTDVADHYTIGLVRQDDKLHFAINGTAMETTDEQSRSFMDALAGAIGDASTYVAYCTVASTGDVSVTVRMVMRDDVAKTGFSVIVPGNIIQAEGDMETGYHMDRSSPAYAVSDLRYNLKEKSLNARVTDVGDNWMWFAVSKTSVASDDNVLPTGSADAINRFVFIITPKNNYSLAQISYWNSNGSAGEAVIDTIAFDWTAEHTYDLRKANDGNWYLAIDEQMISNISSPVLTAFMDANYESLRFGIGGWTAFHVDKLYVKDQHGSGGDIETTGWSYFASSGSGSFDGDEENGYSKSHPNGDLFAFTRETFDITKKSLSLTLDVVKNWFWLGISTTGAEDSNPLPSGSGEEVNRVVFILTPQVNHTKIRVSYWNPTGNGGEHIINLLDFDWSAPHTYDIRQGSDGHWYLAIDSKLITGLTSEVLDAFVAARQKDGLRFTVGGSGGFGAHDIRIVDQKPGDTKVNTDGWRYFSSVGNGDFEGNDTDGYSVSALTGDLFAFTKNTYSITKTGVSFKLTDIRNWLYFSISTTDTSDTNVLNVGAADEVSRMSFIITPKIGATRAQFSFWGRDGRSGEDVIQELPFGWYDEHTLDVRQDAEDGHWYLCIDGRVLSRKYSEVLDRFMELHDPEELYYGIGGSGCFAATDVKIVAKPPIAALDDEDDNTGDGGSGYVPGENDYDFDFDDEHVDDFDNTGDFTFDDDAFDDDPQNEDSKDANAGKVKVRIKKRRLVERGHGIIFTTWEKIGMAAGAVAVAGGLTVLCIFVVRKIKKSKKEKQPLE